MRIVSYKFGNSTDNDMCYPSMDFGKLNLIVGNSGAGKTRLLNTIFNNALMVVQKDHFYIGSWDIKLEHDNNLYRWVVETTKDGVTGDNKVVFEKLVKYDGVEETLVVDRTLDCFKYMDQVLPKLSHNETSIALLQDEDIINPIFEAMKLILRRKFSGSELENASTYQVLPQDLYKKIETTKSVTELFHSNLNLNCKLYVLSQVFKDRYDGLCSEFLSIFPFVAEVKLRDADEFGLHFPPGIVPVFALKEKISNRWVPLDQFSSGMLKVLLILSDIFNLPNEGCVYLIDEFENSLGINAINFFPPLHYEGATNSQFLITSHHPYIIGKIPVSDWLVLHRRGDLVSVQQGKELVVKYGKSKQQAFVQLINDPFYIEGVR